MLNKKGKKLDGTRGRGKIIRCKTLKDAFVFYKKEAKERGFKKESKQIFTKVCKDYNKILMKLVIDESQEVKLPLRQGSLAVVKTELDLEKTPINKLPVNWKKTKEVGYKVYFVQDNIYKLKWIKKNFSVKFKNSYRFKGCRKAVRKIAENIKTKNIDYFS